MSGVVPSCIYCDHLSLNTKIIRILPRYSSFPFIPQSGQCWNHWQTWHFCVTVQIVFYCIYQFF